MYLALSVARTIRLVVGWVRVVTVLFSGKMELCPASVWRVSRDWRRLGEMTEFVTPRRVNDEMTKAANDKGMTKAPMTKCGVPHFWVWKNEESRKSQENFPLRPRGDIPRKNA